MSALAVALDDLRQHFQSPSSKVTRSMVMTLQIAITWENALSEINVGPRSYLKKVLPGT